MHDFLLACRRFFGYAFFFSLFINILQLTFSIYMLQVYDKVLTSYNLSTLAVITLAAVICLVVMALLEWIRSRLLVRAGIAFDDMLGESVLYRSLLAAAAPEGARGSRAARVTCRPCVTFWAAAPSLPSLTCRGCPSTSSLSSSCILYSAGWPWRGAYLCSYWRRHGAADP